MNYGRAFKSIREECHISRKSMAEQIGCTPSALSKIENGKTVPKRQTIHKFCAITHSPIAYFFSKTMDLEDYIHP